MMPTRTTICGILALCWTAHLSVARAEDGTEPPSRPAAPTTQPAGAFSASANSAVDLAAFEPAPQEPLADAKPPSEPDAPADRPAEKGEDSAEPKPEVNASAEEGPSESFASTPSVAEREEPKEAPNTAKTVAQGEEAEVAIPRNGGGVSTPRRSVAGTQGGRAVSGAFAGADRGAPWYRSPYIALGAVLALIFGATVLFRRLVPAARPVAADTLQILGRAGLSSKHSVVLLHLGRRMVLVGVTPDSLQTLSEIRDPEEVAFLLGKAGSAPSVAGETFDASLAGALEKYESQDVVEEDPPDSANDDTLNQTKQQLQGLMEKLRALQAG